MLKVGVLVSGRGSNLESLIKASQKGEMAAKIELVISDNPTAPALQKANGAGIPTKIIERAKNEPKSDFEAKIVAEFKKQGVQLVVLAGFMRILSPFFLEQFPVINIHPSLLPAFPGLQAQKQALEAGVKEAGCTVHWVDQGCDSGPIILQAKVPVLPGDTEETLSARILAEEHKLLPKAIDLIAKNKVRNKSGGGNMKRISILVVLLLAVSLNASARSSKSKTLGVLGMANIQLLNSIPQLDPGPGGGAYFDYRFNQRFSVMVDAWATTHGGSGPSAADDSIQILGIPTFTIKMYFMDDESSRFDPYAGIGIGAYALTEGNVENGSNGIGLGAHIDVGFDYQFTDTLSAGFSGIFRSTALIANLNSSGNNTLAMIPFSLVTRLGFHF